LFWRTLARSAAISAMARSHVPPVIDVGVVTRLEPQHARAVVEMRSVEHVVDVDVAALRAAVAHGGRAREVPDACLEAEIAIGQRADRTDVHHVAGVRIVERLTGVESQFRAIAPVENAEFARLGNLVREAHAA
jgi:hypothetical protein